MSDHEARASIKPPEDATAHRVEARSGQTGDQRDASRGPSVEQRAVSGQAPKRRRLRAPVEVGWSSHPVQLDDVSTDRDDDSDVLADGLTDDLAVSAPYRSGGEAAGGEAAGGEAAGGEAAGGEAAAGAADAQPSEGRAADEATKASGPPILSEGAKAEAATKTRKLAKPRRLTWRPGMVVGGRYHLQRNLGVGGTGLVVEAEDLLLRRPAAVKALRPSVARDPENVERFRKEVALCHAITHPNIVRTYDIGEEDGVHYFSMEYLDGRPLSALLKERPVLEPSEVRRLFIPVCEALQAAHDAKIVHRDLKPSNLMIVPPPRRVVVMDFGISGLVDEPPDLPADPDGISGPPRPSSPSVPDPADWNVTSAGWGTPKYMSPEQWMGEPCGPTSDVYSLGAIMFQCLTGRPPFLADDDRTFAAMHINRDPPRLRDVRAKVPRDLESIVGRCLAKKPSERYRSARELGDALAGRKRVPFWVRLAGRALFLALVMALLGWALITLSNQAIVREMRPAVQRLAELTAQNIAVSDLDAIHEAEDYTRPEFERVREYFLRVAAENPEAFYIYTLRALETPGEWEFVVDKDPFAEDDNQNGIIESEEQGAMPGQHYDGRHLPAMTAALADGEPTADRDFVWDPYGLFLSGYAPIGDNRGEGGYILGIDVTNERLLLFNRVVIGVCVVAWLLLLFAPQLVRLVRRRLRPGPAPARREVDAV